MKASWASEALAMVGAGPAAMVTLVGVEGSAPREAGARMIVGTDRIAGTVGGGNLEFLLIDQARRLMASGRHVLQQDYPLGPLLAQCCGGRVRVLVERLDDASRKWLAQAAAHEAAGERYVLRGEIVDERALRGVSEGWAHSAVEGVAVFGTDGASAGRREEWSVIIEHVRPVSACVYIFGAGHVGRALAPIMDTLPFRMRWIDTREELRGADARLEIEADPKAVVRGAPAGSFFVVLTHTHELDYQLVRAVLARGDAAYCGLIGSATKRARFLSRLSKDGVDATGLTCPIGAGGIKSKLPAAIAVAASAELLVRLEGLNEIIQPDSRSAARTAR
jgi:xanthine dehydrogenase accessory factor